MRKSMLLFAILFILLSSTGCELAKDEKNIEISTIQDLAYDVNPNAGYTVYLYEDSEWTGYLVLTNDYGGNTLLLRLDLLDEPRFFDEYKYLYDNSDIDKFLDDEFVSLLSEELRGYIPDTSISITSEVENSVQKTVTEISRKIFLLSYTEFAFRDISIAFKEGEKLQYFKDGNSPIANLKSSPEAYWTRTYYRGQSFHAVWTVMGNGNPGYAVPSRLFNDERGVRPAFCLPNELAIEKVKLPVELYHEVYILSIEKQFLE